MYIFVARAIYKHLEKCLQEVTIVPHGYCGPIRVNFLVLLYFLKEGLDELDVITCCPL